MLSPFGRFEYRKYKVMGVKDKSQERYSIGFALNKIKEHVLSTCRMPARTLVLIMQDEDVLVL